MTIEQERTVAQRKMQRVLGLIRMLSEGPQSLAEIQGVLGVSNRTAYRYIEMLRCSGIDVIENRQGVFSICGCPFCGKVLQE